MLRCSNQECESHKDGDARFTINVTVDADAQVECLRRVEPDHFQCAACHAEAEEYTRTNDAE